MANGSYGGGTGAKTDPYLLEDYEDLVAFSALVKTNRTISGKLMNDIDMSGKTWSAIGASSYNDSAWTGDFYGNGKTIRNYKGNSSFIGYCNGVVYDLTLDNFNITTDNSNYPGILANVSNPVNCHVTNSSLVTGGGYSGIIMGGAGRKATQCSVKNSRIENTSTNSAVGGIIGWGFAEFCYTENVEVIAPRANNVGGIIGNGSGLSDSILAINCYSKGGRVLGASNVGGICGAGGAKNCYTTTSVYGNSQTGGISGGSASNSSIKTPIEGCVAMNNRIVKRGLTNTSTSFYDISHPTSQSLIVNCIARNDMPFGSEAI